MLLLQGHIPFLRKGDEYPKGSYVAFLPSSDEKGEIDKEENENNKSQATYEHTSVSDKTNLNKDATGNLLLARFFPTGLASLPTCLNVKKTEDFRMFCDKMQELIADRIEKAVSEALSGKMGPEKISIEISKELGPKKLNEKTEKEGTAGSASTSADALILSGTLATVGREARDKTDKIKGARKSLKFL